MTDAGRLDGTIIRTYGTSSPSRLYAPAVSILSCFCVISDQIIVGVGTITILPGTLVSVSSALASD
jgi:hypothetical protein